MQEMVNIYVYGKRYSALMKLTNYLTSIKKGLVPTNGKNGKCIFFR